MHMTVNQVTTTPATESAVAKPAPEKAAAAATSPAASLSVSPQAVAAYKASVGGDKDHDGDSH
jgi:hypothetical protein